MDWKQLLAYITGTVDQALLLRNEYLVTENRILRHQITGRVRLTDGERKTLASPYHGHGLLLAFVVLFAICDASAPTNWAVVGEYFGRQTFSRLQGYIQFANFPGVLCAPVFLGWWYDHHHSYALPLWLYTGVSLVGALTFAVLKRPPSAAPAPGGEPAPPPATAAGSPQVSD